MNHRFFAVAALLLALCGRLPAQTNDPSAELQALVGKINAKLMAGQTAETNLTDEIAEFSALLDKHKAEKTDAVAQILFAKIKLYFEVLRNPERGLELLKQLKSDFPETNLGKASDQMIADVQRQLEAIRMQHSLVPGARFPDFAEKDMSGKDISVSHFKGKVLLVDFWATWCVPCQMQLPYVRKAYEQFHNRGFDIIGISLDNDEQRLLGFLQDRKMSWSQIYQGKKWDNPIVQKYGIQAIPATFLLDGEGKILARDLKGDSLVEAVAKALPGTNAPATTPQVN